MSCKPSDPCYQFGGKVNSMSSKLNVSQSPEGLPLTEPAVRDGMRRRTVGEAMQRAQGVGSPVWKLAKQYPFAKPYAYALQGLTYALILVDPLDRLEGGLID